MKGKSLTPEQIPNYGQPQSHGALHAALFLSVWSVTLRQRSGEKKRLWERDRAEWVWVNQAVAKGKGKGEGVRAIKRARVGALNALKQQHSGTERDTDTWIAALMNLHASILINSTVLIRTYSSGIISVTEVIYDFLIHWLSESIWIWIKSNKQ